MDKKTNAISRKGKLYRQQSDGYYVASDGETLPMPPPPPQPPPGIPESPPKSVTWRGWVLLLMLPAVFSFFIWGVPALLQVFSADPKRLVIMLSAISFFAGIVLWATHD